MNATRNMKNAPMTNNEAMQILSANFLTDTLPQFQGTPRATDTILVSAWTPSTVKANRKAYGIHHATPTQRFHRGDLQMVCQIAEMDPFQTAQNGVMVNNLIDVNCLIVEFETLPIDDITGLEYESGLFDMYARFEDHAPVTTRVRTFSNHFATKADCCLF